MQSQRGIKSQFCSCSNMDLGHLSTSQFICRVTVVIRFRQLIDNVIFLLSLHIFLSTAHLKGPSFVRKMYLTQRIIHWCSETGSPKCDPDSEVNKWGGLKRPTSLAPL